MKAIHPKHKVAAVFHMPVPTDGQDRVLNMIRAKAESETGSSSIALCMSLAFNYGLMTGKQFERELRHWSCDAVLANARAYERHHNGELPKNMEQLNRWMNRLTAKALETVPLESVQGVTR